MLRRLLIPLALVSLVLVPVQAFAEEAAPPTVVVRAPSVEDLLAAAGKLAAQANQKEAFEQVEGLVKSMTGPKGIEGFDPKKPLGAYGRLDANFLDSSVVLLVPVVDEEAALDFISRTANAKPEKDKNGVYSLTPEGQQTPLYFTFANDYLYASNSEKAIAKGELLVPKTLLKGEPGVLLSVRLNLKTVPERMRETVIEEFGKALAKEKDAEKEGESKADRAFRGALLDEIAEMAGQLLNQSEDLSAQVTLNPKTADLSLGVTLTPRQETTLARRIADLEAKSAVAMQPGKESSLLGRVNLTLPERPRKALAVVLEEQLAKARENQQDDAGKALIDALAPTLKEACVDAVLDLRGPSAEKKQYTAVLAGRVKDGLAVEKALRDAYKTFKPEQKLVLTLDADRADKVAVHRFNVGVFYDDNLKAAFGETPVYLALRKDAVFLGVGEDGLKALKQAVTAKEGVVSPLTVRGSLARLAPLLSLGNPNVSEATKAAFEKEAGRDQVELTLSGGKTLQLRVDLQATAFRFLALSAATEQTK